MNEITTLITDETTGQLRTAVMDSMEHMTSAKKLVNQMNSLRTIHMPPTTKLQLSTYYQNTAMTQALSKVSRICEQICRMINWQALEQIRQITNSIAQATYGFATQIQETMEKVRPAFRRQAFLHIMGELGFPAFLETDTELQERILDCFCENNCTINRVEMTRIVLEYCNDGYVDRVLQGIVNVGIFNQYRVIALSQGFQAYKIGLYAPSVNTFANEMSGMISDIHKEIESLHKFTRKEKKEILALFEQKCNVDSEKGKFLQIVCCQQESSLFWYRVAEFFLDVVYNTKNTEVEKYPKRHMICHGNQVEYYISHEMNIKIIMYLDIISELAWRVKKMKEENAQIVIDLG